MPDWAVSSTLARSGRSVRWARVQLVCRLSLCPSDAVCRRRDRSAAGRDRHGGPTPLTRLTSISRTPRRGGRQAVGRVTSAPYGAAPCLDTWGRVCHTCTPQPTDNRSWYRCLSPAPGCAMCNCTTTSSAVGAGARVTTWPLLKRPHL